MLYEVATWLAGTAAMGVMVEENKTKKEKNPWSMTGDFFELQLITLRSKASSYSHSGETKKPGEPEIYFFIINIFSSGIARFKL